MRCLSVIFFGLESLDARYFFGCKISVGPPCHVFCEYKTVNLIQADHYISLFLFVIINTTSVVNDYQVYRHHFLLFLKKPGMVNLTFFKFLRIFLLLLFNLVIR